MVYYKKKRYPTRKPFRRIGQPKRTYRRKRVFKKRFPRANTISLKVQNFAQQYVVPNITVGQEKVNKLTPEFQTTDLISETLAENLSTQVDFVHHQSTFRYFRVRGIKVKLIPEKWQPVTVDPGLPSGANDGQKPKIHWILDEGSVYTYLGDSVNGNLTIQQAESYGSRVKHECEFTRDMTFNIKPYFKPPQTNAYQNYNQPYATMNRWFPTNAEVTEIGRVLPPGNLWFGFTGTVPEWKYRCEITYDLVFKDPYTPTV